MPTAPNPYAAVPAVPPCAAERAADAALDAHMRAAHPGVTRPGWWDIDCDRCDDLAEDASGAHERSHADASVHKVCAAC